jgi:hypothetical protein
MEAWRGKETTACLYTSLGRYDEFAARTKHSGVSYDKRRAEERRERKRDTLLDFGLLVEDHRRAMDNHVKRKHCLSV